MATQRYYSVSEVLESVIEDELSGLKSGDSKGGSDISAARLSFLIWI